MKKCQNLKSRISQEFQETGKVQTKKIERNLLEFLRVTKLNRLTHLHSFTYSQVKMSSACACGVTLERVEKLHDPLIERILPNAESSWRRYLW